MDSSDREEFVRVLNGMAAMKRIDLTEEAYKMWWLAMKAWSIDNFREAAGYLLTKCQFMPTAYDFDQLREALQPSACEAWTNVITHAGIGDWKKGPTGDRRTDTAVTAIGGYVAVAMCNTDKLGFLERRFMDAYNDLSYSDSVRKTLPDLTDRPRLQNGSGVLTKDTETE